MSLIYNILTKKLFVLLLASVCYCNDENPLVKTPLGTIQGYIKTSYEGRKFAAFEGIPFAEPPIGNRRFEEPKPIGPWHGVWDATYLTECSQTSIWKPNTTEGKEDCLHINVYVPREIPNPSEKLDVIVHVHGGAYMYGSGNFYSRPEFILDHEVIFVTFNYRLGILGFLSTEDDVVPGNNGLKDQVVALQWVQKNIASFGGNPDSVTLTGASAGASSVHFHYFSEMSKGLFHRGFSQSGVTLNSFSLQRKSLQKAQRLAEAVGCPSTPTKVLVSCLKQRPDKQLLDKVPLFFGIELLPFAPFAPVVEKGGSKPFLRADPYYLLTKGQVLDVPWISSNTAHEGLLILAFVKQDIEFLNENWEALAPVLLDFNYTLPETLRKTTTEKIREFYLGEDQKITPQNMDKFVKMFSDRIFLVDAEDAVRLQAEVTKSPVYYYYFTYPGDHNEAKNVEHGADIKYYFGSVFDSRPLTPNELKMKDIVIDMLISYAKTGIPVVKGVEWKPTKGDKLTYIDISGVEPGEIKLQTVEELTPRKFWTSLGFSENANLISVKDEL